MLIAISKIRLEGIPLPVHEGTLFKAVFRCGDNVVETVAKEPHVQDGVCIDWPHSSLSIHCPAPIGLKAEVVELPGKARTTEKVVASFDLLSGRGNELSSTTCRSFALTEAGVSFFVDLQYPSATSECGLELDPQLLQLFWLRSILGQCLGPNSSPLPPSPADGGQVDDHRALAELEFDMLDTVPSSSLPLLSSSSVGRGENGTTDIRGNGVPILQMTGEKESVGLSTESPVGTYPRNVPEEGKKQESWENPADMPSATSLTEADAKARGRARELEERDEAKQTQGGKPEVGAGDEAELGNRG
ncbi:unnamed protein product, partial [Discosporangium mesarthrocarpum]